MNSLHYMVLFDFSFETPDENPEIEIVTISNPNEDVESVTEAPIPKKPRNRFKWQIHSEWDDLDAALDFLESEGFVIYDHSDLKCGFKFYFRCKLIPKERKVWCALRYTLFLPSNNMKIIILRNQHEHDHDKLLEGCVRPLSDELIGFIEELFECGTEGSADVLRHIDFKRTKYGLFDSEPNPKTYQIEYLLKKFRKSKVPQMIKLGDLAEWCENNQELPNDVNQAFVIDYEVSPIDEELSFRFTVSTPLLLKKLSTLKTICIDATYKLNYHGFPLMVLGTVDRTKRFHPLAYACCSNERTYDYSFIFRSVKSAIKKHFNEEFEPDTIIADGADPIRNAFYLEFESAQLDIMCYAHVIRNCRKWPFSSKNNKQLIMDDIYQMQLAPNRPTFNMMSKLFCEKWKDIEPDFVAYFKKEWLGPHCNWFEGAAIYTASTNNGQEGHNAVIKRKITLRRRLPMNEFLRCMAQMAKDVSTQFFKNERALATEPNLNKELFESAAIMVVQNFKSFKAKQPQNANFSIYSIPSSACVDSSEKYYKTLVKASWDSFDAYIIHGFQQFYITKFSSDNWKTESTCTCASFFKQHICKHIVAIGVRLNIVNLPQSANPTRLAATRRKPGRPKRTTTALNLQK